MKTFAGKSGSASLLEKGGKRPLRVSKEALSQRIAQMHASFDYVLFRPLAVRAVDATTTHNQVEFMYRHKTTGEMLSGRFRLVLTVEDGRVRRIEEYHDVARVQAFLRLVGGVQPD